MTSNVIANILITSAFIFVSLAAFKISHPQVEFGWLGLALIILVVLLRGLGALN